MHRFTRTNLLRLGRFCVIRCRALLSEPIPHRHHREPPNLVSLLEGAGIKDKKLVCGRPFASLLRSCSLPRKPTLIWALLSGTVQCQYVGGLVRPRKVQVGSLLAARGQETPSSLGRSRVAPPPGARRNKCVEARGIFLLFRIPLMFRSHTHIHVAYKMNNGVVKEASHLI